MALGAVVTDNAVAEPAPYGILSPAVTVVEGNSTRWESGFSFDSQGCATGVEIIDSCNPGVTAVAVEGDGDVRFRDYYPFAIRTEYRCSTMSLRPEEVEDLALRHHEACAQKAIEFEFWTGTLAKLAAEEWTGEGEYPNRYLASTGANDVTPTTGTAVKTKYGLALLEGALADCGCGVRGTIHATRAVASALGLKNNNDRLETTLGNTVVAGPGYTGSAPNGDEPDSPAVWMYATGPVTVHLSEPFVVPLERSQAVDIARNEIVYTVEQVVAVTWDSCCHSAVLVDLSLDYA